MYQYRTAKELMDIAVSKNIKISEVAIHYEAQQEEMSVQDVTEKMRESLAVMKTNIQAGIKSNHPSIGGLIGQNAQKMNRYLQDAKLIGGELQTRAITYALAITEENARMKRIVACPTAGACGVVPGCLVAYCEKRNIKDEVLVEALFNASAIGIIIATNATVSGAEGGCQAEVGAASAMAASALTEIAGGDTDACLNAAAIALKNVLGLVCDPVAGLVEVPCSKRNAMGVANAIAAADMACAGITSLIPLDEVVMAMKEVGNALPYELKETAKGGVANSKTAKQIQQKIYSRNAEILSK